MNDLERIEIEMLRVGHEPLQLRVETFNRLMFEFLSKHGPPGVEERMGKLLPISLTRNHRARDRAPDEGSR